MKGLQRFIKTFIFVIIGACVFRVFALYNDFVRHPELYALQSAPWYISAIITVVLTLVVVAIATIVYFLIGAIIKKHNQEQRYKEMNK